MPSYLHSKDKKYEIFSDIDSPLLTDPTSSSPTFSFVSKSAETENPRSSAEEESLENEAGDNNESEEEESRLASSVLDPYENVQELLEQFINSRLDLSHNVDVITQAFRFVQLDSHLAALALQVR
jgi:hypothetical protein